MGLSSQLQVMVVDDTTVSRGLLNTALQEIGIKNVRLSNDGAEALRSLVAQPCHLVLADYNMPNLDGLGLLKGLRENRSTQRIGFIMVTGKATPELVAAGQKLGMNNILRKPFDTAKLKAVIQAVVGPL